MKRKLTVREQWEIAYRNHRVAVNIETEGNYSVGDFCPPRFKKALVMAESSNYFQACMEGRYVLLATQMANAKKCNVEARYARQWGQIRIQYKCIFSKGWI